MYNSTAVVMFPPFNSMCFTKNDKLIKAHIIMDGFNQNIFAFCPRTCGISSAPSQYSCQNEPLARPRNHALRYRYVAKANAMQLETIKNAR